MRRGLIDSLKFPVAERDYRYDRIKKAEMKKTRDLEEGNGKNQRGEEMRAATGGSASLMRADVPAFVCVLFVCTAVFDLGAQWQSSGHVAGTFLLFAAREHTASQQHASPNHSLLVNTSQSQRHVSRLPISVRAKIECRGMWEP